MDKSRAARVFTLVQRELQEYKGSLFWTPVVTAGVLTFLMLASVLLSGRISALGDTLLQVMMQEESMSGMSISINVDDDSHGESSVSIEGHDLPPTAPDAEVVQNWSIETQEGPVVEEEWNFSREWSFTPRAPRERQQDIGEQVESLNPVLSLLHNVMVMVLVLVTVNYLLGTLFNDRKDRSILFWKSMPVSEWEEVLAKLGVALLVAPAIFIAISVLTQFAYVLLAMLLAYRMDMDPMELIIGKIEFGKLFVDQLGGWLLTALWVAPSYAWLMLASAAAKRSPFMLAVAPVVGLALLETLFIGTDYVGNAVSNHIPHYVADGTAVGFYFNGPDWASMNLLGLGLGLLFAAVLVTATVYLRRYRFEM